MCITAEQSSLWKLNSMGSVVSQHQHGSVFSDIIVFLSALSSVLPYMMTMYLIYAFSDLSSAAVPFLQSVF